MSLAPTYDVLVVGLGPAGSSAAAAAARAGARVLGIERRRQVGVPVQCAEFAPMPLGAETSALRKAHRQNIEEMATFIEGASPDRNRGFRGAMIDRAAFDQALCEDARAAGAELRLGSALESLDGAGIARLQDGDRVCAAAIVGADGPRSKVGATVGAVNRDLLETRQFTAPLTRASASTDIFLKAEIRGGYGWLFPKGEIANVGLGVEMGARARMKPLLEALRGTLVAEGRIGDETLSWTGGAIPVGGALKPTARLGRTAVLLAGDAAGLVNPVTGAGIPAAVISGDLAGVAAARFAAGAINALGDYEDEIEDRFGVSLRRALRRRQEMKDAFQRTQPPASAEWRRGWIAFPEYWAA